MYSVKTGLWFLFRLVIFPGIIIINVNCAIAGNDEIQNLRAFAKLYGYVRYFHPSDEASQIEWDKFAVYESEKVKNAKDSKELKSILEELFLPVAPTIEIYYSNMLPKPLVISENDSNLKVIAWQHQGIGLGSSGNIYKSIRTNRGSQYDFGTVIQSVDASDYRGKEIKLSAFLRTHVSSAGNLGQLWLRVDRQDKQRGFFDNMADRPVKSSEWQEYEIIGDVADDATRITFGCFLKGTGSVWVDRFRLFFREKNGEWQNIPLKNPGFEEEDNGEPAVWIAASPGYSFTLEDKIPVEGKFSLLIKDKQSRLMDRVPDVAEVVRKEIGRGLSCQVPLALYSDENGTIGPKDHASFDRLVQQLKKINTSEMKADRESVRLADIIITWNIFQHFYPYFDVLDTDWDNELSKSLSEVLQNKNEKDFYGSLKKLVAKLQDGHGRVYHRLSEEEAGFPFLVDWIENQTVIIFSKDTTRFKVGDIIETVNGTPAEQIIKIEEEFISGSPQWKRFRALQRFAYDIQGTKAIIQFKRSNQLLKVEATRNNKEWLSEPGRPNIEELENDIYYVNLDKAEMPEINEKMNDIANARGVIFDLRGYPKGNHEVISHLLSEPDTSASWMRVPQIIYPDQERIVGFIKRGWLMQPKEPHIGGKVVFITDGRAISYAESFMGLIEHYKLAEIIGQSTAGTNGNINPFELPGGFRVTWTGMRVVKHNGSQHHLIGIQPTIPAQRTIQGVIEGRDEFFEKALEVIKSGL